MTPAMSSALQHLRQLTSSTLFRQVVATFSTRVSMLVVGLAMSIVISRVLGPGGRGEFAFAAALTGLVSQLGNLGLHSSNTFFASKRRELVPALVANSLWASLCVGVFVSAILWLVRLISPELLPVSDSMLALVALSAPLGVAFLLLQQLYLALGRVRAFNGVEVVQRLLSAAASILIILVGLATPEILFGVTFAAMLAVFLWMYGAFPTQRARRPDWGVFRSTIGYGLRAYFTALAAYVVLRVDVLLVGGLAGEEATGHYSVVVAMADLVCLLPVVMGTLLFPRLSATTDPSLRWLKARRAALAVGGSMVVIALLSGVAAEPVVRLLYGEDFVPAAPALVVLLPGLVAMGVNVILMNYLASIGMPIVTIVSPALAGLANVALNVALVPSHGIVGASWASTVSYALMLGLSLTYLRSRAHRTVAYGSARRSQG